MGSALDFLNAGNPFAGDGGDAGGDPDGSGVTTVDSGAGWGTGLLQSLTTLGTGYLSKRLDVDLQQRVTGNQAFPQLRTTQNGLGGYGTVVRTPGGAQVAQVNLSAIMPLALVALVAYFMAKRGG